MATAQPAPTRVRRTLTPVPAPSLPKSPSRGQRNINGSPVTATGPSLISVDEAAIAFRTSSTNGTVPLQVQFTSANVDLAGNPIVKWNWDFGDGSTSTAQTPIHIYTSANSFSPTLAATNSIGSTITGFGPVLIIATNVPVYSGLVLNGGFETGDLNGWTYSGAASNSFNVFVDNGSQSEIAPNSGTYLAAFCPLGSPGYISQTLATTAGTPYLLSLWLDSPDGGSPNQFMVSWNGTTLFNQANIANIGWTNLQFWVTATGTATALEIGGRDDPSYLGIDNVSVVPAVIVRSLQRLRFFGEGLRRARRREFRDAVDLRRVKDAEGPHHREALDGGIVAAWRGVVFHLKLFVEEDLG